MSMTFIKRFWAFAMESDQDIHARLKRSRRFIEVDKNFREVEQAFRDKLTEALNKEYIDVSEATLTRELVIEQEYYMQGFRDGIALIGLIGSDQALEELVSKAEESAPVEAGGTL